MKPSLLLAAAALLQACAGEVMPDLPKHPTAVTKSYFHNLGFKGLFASETTQTVSTRADMRRTESTFKFSGFVMKHLASAHDNVMIWRVDKNKIWMLDPKAKTYMECALTGCPHPAQPERPQQQPGQRPEQTHKKPSCPLTLARSKFHVEPTSETKEINGFSTKLYKATWEVVLQDKAKKKNTSLVSVDVWTTPEDNPKLEAVRTLERSFEDRLREKRPEYTGLGKVIPTEAFKIIAMQFLADLTPEQRTSAITAGQEFAKIHGRPVLTHLEWNLGGDACSDARAPSEPREQPKQGLDLTHGIGGFLGSAASRGVQNKAEELSNKPVFAFDQELKKMEVEDATDGLFVVPPSYKLVSPRN